MTLAAASHPAPLSTIDAAPTTAPDGLNNNKNRPPARPIDRNWMRNLLSTHASHASHSHSETLLPPTCPALTDPALTHKALAVAPMVDQSDLPFRLLCRQYGANLAYTPMFHAQLFVDRPKYREKFWNFVDGTPEADRPLVAQFCGSDPDKMLQAMQLVEKDVDAVDINCGCPQSIAKRGKYGAFLLEDPNLPDLVRHLASNLSVPLCVKVRILPSGIDDSLDLYEKLIDAGAALITVHGRTRHQKGHSTGSTDWDAIRRTVDRVGHRVPVFANGSISNLDEARDCLVETGADGIMSAEGILEYPPLFMETGTKAVEGRRTGPGRAQLAREYLDLATLHPPNEGGQGSGMKCVRAHLHRILHADLQTNDGLRNIVAFGGDTMPKLYEAVAMVEKMHEEEGHNVEDEVLSWYVRHRRGEDGLTGEERAREQRRKNEGELSTEPADDDEVDEDDAVGGSVSLFGGGEVCDCGGDY